MALFTFKFISGKILIFRYLNMVEQTTASAAEDEKSRALAAYRRKLVEYREVEERLKQLRKKVGSQMLRELELWFSNCFQWSYNKFQLF